MTIVCQLYRSSRHTDSCLPQGLVGAGMTLGLLAFVPETALPAALAILVGVVGMPHGGLDHRVGRLLLAPALGRTWPLAFLTSYAAVMAIVFTGWLLSPVLTLAGFVLLSALHFGTADEPIALPGGLALTMLQGGMVIWVPALFQPAEFTRLVGWVVPGDLWPEDIMIDAWVRMILGAAVIAVVVRAIAYPSPSRLAGIVFAAVFAIAPPLVSFLVYFCGWHSVIELTRLARQAKPDDPGAGLVQVIGAAAPLAILAVVLGVVGWMIFADRSEASGLIQTVFVGLSVVAVPHMLLHLIASQNDVNPFHCEVVP